jgi:hypothetical protein
MRYNFEETHALNLCFFDIFQIQLKECFNVVRSESNWDNDGTTRQASNTESFSDCKSKKKIFSNFEKKTYFFRPILWSPSITSDVLGPNHAFGPTYSGSINREIHYYHGQVARSGEHG